LIPSRITAPPRLGRRAAGTGSRRRTYGDGPIEYSHTLTKQIGGQLAAGFTLTHLVEAPHHADATARYMPGYFATRAVKPPRA
jgi:hypothetical protein